MTPSTVARPTPSSRRPLQRSKDLNSCGSGENILGKKTHSFRVGRPYLYPDGCANIGYLPSGKLLQKSSFILVHSNSSLYRQTLLFFFFFSAGG